MFPDDHNRAFHYAVLASLVLHAVLLFGISQRDRPHPLPPQPPIFARLVEPPEAPAARPPAAAAQPRVAEPVKPRPRAKPPTRKPAAREEPVPRREAPMQAAPEEPVVAEAPPQPEPAPAPPPVIAKVDPAPRVPADPVPEAVPDAGTLAQYRLQVISAARNYKRYPRVAIDNNWEGDVVVRMAMGANGKLAVLTIQSSSGHAVLDQQALEMFRKASAAVPIPPGLRGKDFALELRAIYNLRDQDSG